MDGLIATFETLATRLAVPACAEAPHDSAVSRGRAEGIMTDTQGGRERDQPKGPNLWIGPVLATVVIVVPVLVLVFSNTESIEVTWAGFAVTAPRWVALLAAFVGGMVAGPLLGWVWRRWRRHRRHLRDERDTLRRHRVDD